jgi:hypothetical protein
MEDGALDSCVEVRDAREFDADGQFFARGLACPDIFGAPKPDARRPSERDRRFGRITLRRPMAHPLTGPHPALRELPVLPSGLRGSGPAEHAHPLTARYARILGANASLTGADYPSAFRTAYAELCTAVADLMLAPESSLLALLGASKEERWQRLMRLDERAAGKDFDPVWADDEDTHLSLAALAGLGLIVSPR